MRLALVILLTLSLHQKTYDGIIQRKHKGLDIHHYVIFLGKGKMTMKTRLPERHVFREFKVLSINELDFDEMLQSQIPEELVLAILSDFKGKDPEEIIRLITEKLKKCSNSDADLKKFKEQLTVLSRLRKLEEKIIKNNNNMPITYNLEEDYCYQMGIEKGREQERKIADVELQERLRKQLKENITTMLVLGLMPEQIANHLKVSIEFIKEIQQELN